MIEEENAKKEAEAIEGIIMIFIAILVIVILVVFFSLIFVSGGVIGASIGVKNTLSSWWKLSLDKET